MEKKKKGEPKYIDYLFATSDLIAIAPTMKDVFGISLDILNPFFTAYFKRRQLLGITNENLIKQIKEEYGEKFTEEQLSRASLIETIHPFTKEKRKEIDIPAFILSQEILFSLPIEEKKYKAIKEALANNGFEKNTLSEFVFYFLAFVYNNKDTLTNEDENKEKIQYAFNVRPEC